MKTDVSKHKFLLANKKSFSETGNVILCEKHMSGVAGEEEKKNLLIRLHVTPLKCLRYLRLVNIKAKN